MTFDFVLNNDSAIVFPDTVGLGDNMIYDPATGRLYNDSVDANENDYEYRWSQDKWVSHVDLSMRKLLDDNFVNIPGDVMTGGLQMGLDIDLEQVDPLDPVDPNRPMFKVRRYNLQSLPWITYDVIKVIRNHTLRCKEYILNNRVTVDSNAIVLHVKQPEYKTEWYNVKLDPAFYDTIAGVDLQHTPIIPTEDNWTNDAVLIGEGTSIVLSSNLIEGNSWVRSIQTITELSDEVNPKPLPVTSICDTPFITHQTTIPTP